MKRWILKAVAQKALSWLPAHQLINNWFQRKVIRSVRITDFFFTDRLDRCREHLQAWHRLYPVSPPDQSLELGTGWYPVIPVGMFLCGVKTVRTVDIVDLLTLSQVRELLHFFLTYYQSGKLQELLPFVLPERWEILESLFDSSFVNVNQFLATLQIHRHICDARSIPLPDQSIPLITSNNTFEHIPASVLKEILVEFRRVIRPGGVMSHYIDMVDHYSYFDPSISAFHFLKYSPRKWNWIENRIQAQNRMRISQYRTLFREAGIPIIEEINENGDLVALAKEPLHPFFKEMPIEDVSVCYSQVISHC